MTLEQFQKELKASAPHILRASESDGLEILLTDGYCQVMCQGICIGSADISDEGGWGNALDKSIEWLKNPSPLE